MNKKPSSGDVVELDDDKYLITMEEDSDWLSIHDYVMGVRLESIPNQPWVSKKEERKIYDYEYSRLDKLYDKLSGLKAKQHGKMFLENNFKPRGGMFKTPEERTEEKAKRHTDLLKLKEYLENMKDLEKKLLFNFSLLEPWQIYVKNKVLNDWKSLLAQLQLYHFHKRHFESETGEENESKRIN